MGHSDNIEIKGRQLIVHFRKTRNRAAQQLSVEILAEQIGYNVNNKEYKTILIDRPLLAPDSGGSSSGSGSIGGPLLLRSILSPTFRPSPKKRRRQPPRALLDHNDCFQYLECLSHSVTKDLESDVKRLQSNYLILAEYLDDAATRIRDLVECYLARYATLATADDDESLSDSVRRSICLSIENVAVHLLHNKLMAAIKLSHKDDDKLLLEKFQAIRDAKLNICQLGAQTFFDEFVLNEEILRELRQLPTLESPQEIVSCLMRSVALISEALNQSVRFKLLMGTGDKATICSDDLIASFVFALAKAKPNHLYSVSKYLEIFSWHSSARDQAAYYVATFQIVVQYVLGYTNEEDVARAGKAVPTGEEPLGLNNNDEQSCPPEGCRMNQELTLELVGDSLSSPPPVGPQPASRDDSISSGNGTQFADSLESSQDL